MVLFNPLLKSSTLVAIDTPTGNEFHSQSKEHVLFVHHESFIHQLNWMPLNPEKGNGWMSMHGQLTSLFKEEGSLFKQPSLCIQILQLESLYMSFFFC